MDYRQTLEYLYSQLPMFQRIGAAAYKADLGNTHAMCELLGHPEKAFRSVHIAGTNGKGSTSHLIASVLQSAGFKTGLHTSPHLKDFRERIRINGKMIPRSYVSNFVSQNRKRFESIRPSFFEYTTLMAFDYFRAEIVDIAVIETGMGGRLDSTNVITPLLSVITNISFDHTAFLGDTLSKIATEKAGIIKPGVPVVIGETQPETREIFLQKAAEMNARAVFADQNLVLTWIDLNRKAFRIHKRDGVPDNPLQTAENEATKYMVKRDGVPMECPLKGIYQEKNLITAYQALKLMNDRGFRIQESHIADGFRDVIKNTGLQGRWQTLKRKPKVICDVGHNEAGIRYIIEQLKIENFQLLHWVIGMVNDKDAEGILKLLPRDAIYYFCKADIPRGLDARVLQDKAKAFGLNGNVYPSVKDAYLSALSRASDKDLVFVGGSTFIVAEVL